MRHPTRLRSDARGAALTEFGLIAPLLMILVMGALDMGHRLYARSVLQGAVQRAARDASLEDATEAERQEAIDAKMMGQIIELHNGLEQTCDENEVPRVCVKRVAYRSFSQVEDPEENFTDLNEDKRCNNNEPWMDINNNGIRDKDIGVEGQGGAQDAVVYSVRLVYPPMTPVSGLFGLDGNVDMTARTILRNQPYNDQGSDGAPTLMNCS